ncbi:hypothetical protein D083_0652 [Dickeya solani RNS 08.23.3.1.A]|nr:hypothetical protein D083_0652 [Dickeya solani RNS 08.23.3.1.A]
MIIALSNTRFAGCLFHGDRIMLRRYSFEIVLSFLLICALVIVVFFL